MKGRLLIGTALGLALVAASAQAQTVISPDVGARGLGTTATTAGNVTTIGGGTLAGGNLFQSFSAFSLNTGDVARWTLSSGDPTTVHNVVNRVTGGQPSQIGGTIDSTSLPNAAFFFLNPAGVVFGAGAQVNVPSAAYFSTASELRFADGARFAMATPGGSTLSIAAPQSFGFVGGQGAVAVNGATAGFATAGAALSLSGANVSVANSTFHLRSLDLAAVGTGSIDLPLANPLPAALGGVVSLQNSQLTAVTDSGGGGALRIGGGNIALDNALIVSDTASALRGADLTINAAGTLSLIDNSRLFTNARGSGAGGDLTLTAQAITADNGSAAALSQADGPGGRVSLTADTIALSDNFTASSTVTGSGAGGAVAITARSTLTMDNAFATATTLASGAGGDLTLSAPVMQLNGALAFTQGVGAGRPGNVRLAGGTITASAGLLGSAPGSTTDTGSLDIEATTSFTGTNGVSMSAASQSAGVAGVITISAPKIVLQNAFIDTDSYADGGAGTVTLQGGDITLTNAQIEAEARGATTSQTGLVQLKATGDINISQGMIASDAFSTSPGGTVSISGGNVTLDNGAKVESNSAGEGGGGQILIKASGTLHVTNLSSVSSDAQFVGDAGDVSLNGQTITIDGGSLVSSDTLSSARSGAVTVSAGTLNVTGQGAISSSTFGEGPAGNVTVTADTLIADKGGAIVSQALEFSTGQAGVVTVNAGTLKVADEGIISTSTAGSGDAGALSITAKSLSVDNGEVSSGAVSGATGASGSLSINAGSLSVTDGGIVTTLSNNTHPAGQITVTAGQVTVSGTDSAISSENQAGNRALGNRRGQTGDAGSIQLNAGLITVAEGGAISTDSFAGAAGQIDISIRTPGMLVLEGVKAPGTIQTSSGPGAGGKITIDEPLAVVSNGGSILALGQLNGANVDIDSKYFINSTDRVNTIEVAGEIHLQAGLYDVSSGTISHDVSVLDASKVLRGQCPAVRAAGATSQLVTRPVGPYVRPAAPDAKAAAPGKPVAPGDCL